MPVYEKDLKYTEDAIALYEHQPYTGVAILKYESGEICSKISFNKGMKDGPLKAWYKDGTLQYEAIYQNGLPEGKEVWYYSSGTPEIISNYKSGELSGKQTYFYPNKVIKAEIDYKMNAIHGRLVAWYLDGNLSSVGEYQFGVREGKYLKWSSLTGEKIYDAHYSQNKLDGVLIEYDLAGRKKRESFYTFGDKDEKEKIFHGNGNIKTTGEYALGRKHGTWEAWDIKGNKTVKVEYYFNKMIFKEKYNDNGSIKYNATFAKDDTKKMKTLNVSKDMPIPILDHSENLQVGRVMELGG